MSELNALAVRLQDEAEGLRAELEAATKERDRRFNEVARLEGELEAAREALREIAEKDWTDGRAEAALARAALAVDGPEATP